MDRPSGFGGGLGRDAYVTRRRKETPATAKSTLSSKPTKKSRKRPRQNSSTSIYPSSLTAFDSPQHPPGVISKYSNKPPTPPQSKADVQRELFLQNERRAGQHFHHANLQHTVGKGASMFFSMFEETVQKATLDIDRKAEVKEEVKTGLFRLDKIETVQPKPKRQRSLPQNKGTHTLFLNRALSGVQPPKQLTPRTKSKATSLSLMGVDTSMAVDSVKVVADKRAKCSLSLRCTGARATKRCYTCVEYNPQTDGNYCNECFDATHPWYRVKHNWAPLALSDDPRSKWVGDIQKADIERKMEELGALLALAQEANAQLGDIKSTATTSLSAIATATTGFLKMEDTVTDLKESVGRMFTKRQAATMVQNAWRRKVARREIQRMIREQWQKFKDKKSGKFYYMNVRTGRVTWTKPKILGDKDIEKISHGKRKGAHKPKRKPRFTAAELTTDEAARVLQGCYRNRQARKLLRRMVREQYKKVKDPATGKFYYYNTRTKVSHWTKPKFLGDDDLDKPESRTPRFRHWELTSDEAARHLQGAWRAKVARRRIRVMVRNQYRKKWDDKKQKFYYYNKRTKTSHWTKPLCLGSEDLVLSARTREISGYVSPRRTPRVHAEDLDDETAAKMLQGAWRAKIARRKLKAMVRRQYKKCWDEGSKKFYYYNSRTGESHWTRPLCLYGDDLELTPRTMLAAGVKPPHRSPRVRAADLDDASAAKMLQSAWRSKIARRKIKQMVRGVYKKCWDESSKTFYYYNTRTNQAHWTKPLCLGDDDLELTPRTMLAAHVKPPKKTPRFTAKDLTPEDAAKHLQGCWRNKVARRKIRVMVRNVYKKCWDDSKQMFYYFNKRTKESHWTKPICLGSEDLAITARTRKSPVMFLRDEHQEFELQTWTMRVPQKCCKEHGGRA